VLSAGVLSPTGTDTLAVSLRLPVAAGSSWIVKVYVTDEPTARLAMVSDRAPETLVWPLPLQVAEVMPEGSTSFTANPVASDGPLLVTTIV